MVRKDDPFLLVSVASNLARDDDECWQMTMDGRSVDAQYDVCPSSWMPAMTTLLSWLATG